MFHFQPISLTIPHVAYACLGGFVVIFGMFSLLLREKLYIGEACWAFLFGVIIGPFGANIFNPRGWGGGNEEVTNTITLEFTRVVLAIGVFAIGVELPKAYMARHWKSIFFLLVPVMSWGWFVSAGLIYALIPGLNFLSSLAVAACLTPTDPILAAAVVGGKYADKHVPAHLRHLLAAESGCNDGAAFPFLYIALYLILESNTGNAVGHWFFVLWLYEIILGIVIGALIGFAFRHLMKFCQRRELIDRHSYVAQYVSLAIFTIGVTTILGSDDLLAAFACGTAFAWDGFFNKQTEESVFSSVIDLLFNVAAFVFVGAWMPFDSFSDEDLTLSVWRLIVIAVLVLILRRLPIMIALYRWIPDIKTFREAIFSGHFGPIGIGGVFISTLASQQLRESDSQNAQTILLARVIQPIVAFMVLCSIITHGLSIPSFSLGRRVHTVSRTWSRHAPPDWTNQARFVSRGDDIVINRDIEMGQGGLTPDDKASSVTQRRPLSAGEAEMVSSTLEKKLEDDESLKMQESRQEEEMKKETPPDGNEIVQEWQEGHYKVIERRTGPGEDVEVEVVRNALPAEGESRVSSFFRGQEATVRGSVAAYLDKHRHSHHPHKNDDGTPVHDEPKKTEGPAEDIPPSQAIPPADDEEDGWASDRSGDQGSSSALEPAADRRKRSKSQKQKNVPKPSSISGRRARRQTSIRKGLLGHAQEFIIHSHTSRTAKAAEEDEERGRFSSLQSAYYSHPSTMSGSPPGMGNGSRPSTGSTSQPSTADNSRPGTADSSRPGTSPNSVRNFRLEQIKAFNSRREASPTRSVRFVGDEDRHGSGASTPRLSVFQQDSTPGTPVEGDVEDAPKAKVTFDLPEIGEQ